MTKNKFKIGDVVLVIDFDDFDDFCESFIGVVVDVFIPQGDKDIRYLIKPNNKGEKKWKTRTSWFGEELLRFPTSKDIEKKIMQDFDNILN